MQEVTAQDVDYSRHSIEKEHHHFLSNVPRLSDWPGAVLTMIDAMIMTTNQIHDGYISLNINIKFEILWVYWFLFII